MTTLNFSWMIPLVTYPVVSGGIAGAYGRYTGASSTEGQFELEFGLTTGLALSILHSLHSRQMAVGAGLVVAGWVIVSDAGFKQYKDPKTENLALGAFATCAALYTAYEFGVLNALKGKLQSCFNA